MISTWQTEISFNKFLPLVLCKWESIIFLNSCYCCINLLQFDVNVYYTDCKLPIEVIIGTIPLHRTQYPPPAVISTQPTAPPLLPPGSPPPPFSADPYDMRKSLISLYFEVFKIILEFWVHQPSRDVIWGLNLISQVVLLKLFYTIENKYFMHRFFWIFCRC